MSDAAPRAWSLYLDDMIGFAERVGEYTEGLDQATFVSIRLRYDATVRNVELLGEAATHIPDVVRQQASHIPWRLIIPARNRLIHGHLGIDDDILWNIVREEIPALLIQLRELRRQQD